MPKIKTFLAFGCAHRPMHDIESWAWLIEQIKERQPQVLINLGDYGDNACVSSWRVGDEAPLRFVYASMSQGLHELNEAALKAKKILHKGNHDDRILRPEWAKVSDLLEYRTHIKELKPWKIIERRLHPDNVFWLGQVSSCHGFAATKTGNAEKLEALELGTENGLHISAHTHRPVGVQRVKIYSHRFRLWRANPGCLIDFSQAKEQYMNEKNDSMWGHAIVTGWANTKRRHDGKRNWEAETIIRRMAWDG